VALREQHWQILLTQARAVGLNHLRPASREAVEARFAGGAASLPTQSANLAPPSRFHPDYRCALLLGSAGPAFWQGFRIGAAGPPDLARNPLDAYSERVVEALAGILRAWDPTALAVYPFRHLRRLLGFQWLADAAGAPSSPAPFGVALDVEFGPWFAWRGALLTRLAPPPLQAPLPAPAAGPCAPCPAPCAEACPAGAVSKSGFDWQRCAAYRLAEPTCKETCLARLACPVGTAYRYGPEQMAYHYRASLREIEAQAKDRTQ
jgi:hypothetical protein